ncbi:MAG: carbohydrate ABC transporter permease, partial [Lacrimispora sphenoides]
STNYAWMMAAAVIALIPVFIIFIALQKYFVQGVATSGLKG